MSDLISRQALLDKFEQWQKTEDYSNDEWNLLVDVLSVIKSMPPAPELSTNLAEVGTDCISRQAAIDALDTLAESYADDTEDDYFTGCYSGVNRSIDAIKALATDINVGDKDTISRQAAIETIDDLYAGKMPFTVTYDAINSAFKALIRMLPSAEPKRIRGKWVPITNGRLGHECDQCHEYAPSFESGNEYLSRFCPNCGADMRGEQDG